MCFPPAMKYKFSLLLIGLLVLLGCSRNLELIRPAALPLQSDLLFVCNTRSDYVSVINTATNSVVASIEADQPWGVMFSPDGTKGYISCLGSGTLKMFNGYNMGLIDYINIGLGSPVGIVVNSVLDKVYVAAYARDSVQVIDPVQRDWVSQIDVGDGPQWAVSSTDESKIYVVNTKDDTLSVIDPVAGNVIKTLSLPYYSYGIALNPHDHKIYITSFGMISILDPLSSTLEASIMVGGGTKTWIEFSAVSDHAYISDLSYDLISVYDLTNRRVIEDIPVDDGPHCMARNTDGSKIFVSCAYSDNVVVINTLTNTIEARIGVGETPIGMCFRE